MKKNVSLVVLLILCISITTGAFAASARIEEIEYKGFGVIKIDFLHDCRWYPDAKFTLTDPDAKEYETVVIGGEEDEAFLFVRDLPENVEYKLKFELDGNVQELVFTAVTGTEYHYGANGVTPIVDKDRCDRCGKVGHDDDFCPEIFANVALPEDLTQLALLFDIDLLPIR